MYCATPGAYTRRYSVCGPPFVYCSRRVESSMPAKGNFLPPATKLWQGNVFTPVCDFVHAGGGLCPGVSVQGGLCPGDLCPGGSLSGRPPCHHTVTCGWYTSYWNAFLLLNFFALIQSGRSDRMVYLRKNSILDS